MALHIASRFFQLPSSEVNSNGSRSKSLGHELRASSAVASVLLSRVSSQSGIWRSYRLISFQALLCNAISSDVITTPSVDSSQSRPSPEITGTTAVSLSDEGEEGLWSVVIPTYNRLPILTKCLEALEEQKEYKLGGVERYEVVVVDDGSTDGTLEFLRPRNPSHNCMMKANPNLVDVKVRNRPHSSKLSDDVLRSSTNAEATLHLSSPTQLANREEEEKSYLESSLRFPHVKVIRQQHGGATRARNLGVRKAMGAVIVFIDSDLVVTNDFLRAHGAALLEAQAVHGNQHTFTYGRVVNTANFEKPESENFKLTDNSAAFFATGNVAISRTLLLKAGNLLTCKSGGPFDSDFSEYGWEDLELGVRLKQVGAKIRHVPQAIGYHWHPAFSMDQIPKLIDQERQRGRNGVRFFLKHPNLNVRLMTQLTPFHEALWFLLTLGGLMTEQTLNPILCCLVNAKQPGLAATLLSPTLNWHTVQAAKQEVKNLKERGEFVKRKV